MERNTETLSTRDLASPNEQAGDVTTSQDDVRDTAAPEGQPEVYDQAASAAEGTRVPADEQTAPPGEVRAAGSATDQSVEAGRPGADLGTESGAPGHAAEDRPANSTQAVSTPDQDTQAAPYSTAAAASTSNGGSLLPADMDATFQQRWRRSRPGSSTSPEGRSRTPIAWSRTSCSNSQRASPRNGNGSKHNGAVARTSPPRTCGSPCSAIGPSSSACCRPDSQSRIAPRGPADAAGPRRVVADGIAVGQGVASYFLDRATACVERVSCGAFAQPRQATRCLRRGESGSSTVGACGSTRDREGRRPAEIAVAVATPDCEETATTLS